MKNTLPLTVNQISDTRSMSLLELQDQSWLWPFGSSDLWAAYNDSPELSLTQIWEATGPQASLQLCSSFSYQQGIPCCMTYACIWTFQTFSKGIRRYTCLQNLEQLQCQFDPALMTFVEGQGQGQFIGNKDTSHKDFACPMIFFYMVWNEESSFSPSPFSFSLLRKKKILCSVLLGKHHLPGHVFAGAWIPARATVVFNSVSQPMGIERPFHRDHLTQSENTDIYIPIHNSSKIPVMK